MQSNGWLDRSSPSGDFVRVKCLRGHEEPIHRGFGKYGSKASLPVGRRSLKLSAPRHLNTESSHAIRWYWVRFRRAAKQA